RDFGDRQQGRARLDQLPQVAPAQVFHRQVGRVARIAEIHDTNDVAMVHLRYRQRFAQEPLPHLFARAGTELLGADDLEGNHPPQPGVDGPVDRAHPAFGDQLVDLEAIDAVTTCE